MHGRSPEPPTSKIIFSEDFTGINRGWHEGPVPGRETTTYESGTYDTQTSTAGNALWAGAPVNASDLVSSMEVKTLGRLVSPDQGGWGEWCRTGTGNRYELLLSPTGTAVITGPDGCTWIRPRT